MDGVKQKYSPSEILNAFHLEKCRRGPGAYPYDLVELNKAFYAFREEILELCENYEFIKVINPYSPTLENSMAMAALTGQISTSPEEIVYINPERIDAQDEKIMGLAEKICNFLESDKAIA